MELVKAFTRWWPCACLKWVSGLRSPEKSLNFSNCIFVFDLVLQCCSDITYWNWMQLFFYLIVSIDIVGSVVGTCFLTVFHVWDWSFFLLLFEETFAVGFQKWFDYKWIEFVFFLEIRALFVDFGSEWTKNFKKCWNLCLIWRHQVFSITSWSVNPVCCSNVLVLFSHTFL